MKPSSSGASGASSSTSSTSASSHLNESDPLDENYITLLQYRGASHILNLISSDEHSPHQIIEAYKQTREQTVHALSKCEDQLSRGRNAFFMSQANYFELKLRALDQALGEMLGDQLQEHLDELGLGALDEEGLDGDDVFDEEPVAVNDPSNQPRREDVAAPIAQPKPSEDELDTIHIYFQPQQSNGIPQRTTRHHRKLSHSTDLSSVSWDISKMEDSDDEGLERLLGPLGEKDRQQQKQHSRCARRKEESPRGVMDFPKFEFAEPPIISRQEDDIRSQRPPTNPTKRPQAMSTEPPAMAQSTIEAARKGVLRALSEDDSECLPLEEGDEMVKNSLEAGDVAKEYEYEDQEEMTKTEDRTWQLDKTSPVKSVKSESHQSHFSRKSGSSRRSGSQRSNASSRKSTYSKTAARSKKPALETVPSSAEVEEEDVPIDAPEIQRLEAQKEEEDYYDSLFQSGMDLAEDICGMCWWDSTAAAASPHKGSGDFSSWFLKEEESVFSEECTVTDGESTTFNFTSTYSMEIGLAESRTSPENYLERKYREKKRLV